jgi:hypothetical protein
VTDQYFSRKNKQQGSKKGIDIDKMFSRVVVQLYYRVNFVYYHCSPASVKRFSDFPAASCLTGIKKPIYTFRINGLQHFSRNTHRALSSEVDILPRNCKWKGGNNVNKEKEKS